MITLIQHNNAANIRLRTRSKVGGEGRSCPKPKPKETAELRGWLGVTSYFITKNCYIGGS